MLRGNPDGSSLRLGDVARVELGAADYSFVSRYNGQPASGIAISLTSGANSIETSRAVEATLEQLKLAFPPGLKAVVPFDTTPFVRVAIQGVILTLLEAIALVFLVMYLFLQNLRATLIPTIAVPVVLLGTFAVLAALGYSVNMLTMFAMVLAIGLLVDDAIVVVENVERVMRDEGLSAVEATRKSMDQITGALVGIGLVLAAVFVPMAFLTGSTGIIYRQFSATIVSAMALSVLVALVLTPALCATLLKPADAQAHASAGGFFGWFNRTFDRGNARHRERVRGMLSRRWRFMAAFGAMVALMIVLFLRLPSAFLPQEDQGWMLAQVVAPVGATQQRTMKAHRGGREALHERARGEVGLHRAGLQLRRQRPEHRHRVDQPEGLVGAQVAGHGRPGRRGSRDGRPDADQGRASPSRSPRLRCPSSARRRDSSSTSPTTRVSDARRSSRRATSSSARPRRARCLANVRPNGLEDAPQLRIKIDPGKSAALGLLASDINATLGTAWGGQYIDDFVDRGRVKRVYVQSDAPFRMVPEDFNRWTVRNVHGEMVPFSAFATWNWEFGSPRLERYNGTPALEINGEAAPGVSSGTAMAEVERLVAQLPKGIGLEWTGQSYQERSAGAQTPLLYTLSLLVVFLCLAAMYESWTIPTAVLLVVPLGILGTVLAATLRGMERDVYFQVAMLTTVGLSSKNAILIIAFAKENLERGMDLVRGHDERRARPVAPDPDDLARLRARRTAACTRDRRRLGSAARDRHRRARRHDRRHAARHLLHAALLRRGAAALRPPEARRTRGHRRLRAPTRGSSSSATASDPRRPCARQSPSRGRDRACASSHAA